MENKVIFLVTIYYLHTSTSRNIIYQYLSFSLKIKVIMKNIVLFSLLLIVVSCSTTPWNPSLVPDDDTIEKSLMHAQVKTNIWDLQIHKNDNFEIPKRIRPCCAYGFNQQVRVGVLPVPLFRLANTSEVDSLGAHSYNATYMTSSDYRSKTGTREDNGLIYTLKGGLLDVAHIRDTADMTVAMFYIIYPNLGKDLLIKFPPEMGNRTLQFFKKDLTHLSSKERWEIAIELSGRIGYQVAVAHEMAQWHGLKSFPLYPEAVSAYSPEDLYSNMLGAKIATSILKSNLAINSRSYNQNFTIWLKRAIEYLRPLDKEETNAMLLAVDQYYWDSNARLPDKYLVLKRNYNVGHNRAPHLFPKEVAMASKNWKEVEKFYEQYHSPVNISQPNRLHGVALDDIVQFKIYVNKKFEKYFTHIPASIWKDGVTSNEFQKIVEYDSLFDKKELEEIKARKK